MVSSRPSVAAAAADLHEEKLSVDDEKVASLDEEWEENESNEALFKMDEKEKEEKETEEEVSSTNPRFEFHPHIKPMDQFHIREIVRIGRHMKATVSIAFVCLFCFVLFGFFFF